MNNKDIAIQELLQLSRSLHVDCRYTHERACAYAIKCINALTLLKEDMATIDRMPFQSIGEVAEFAGESLAKHAESMRAVQ